MKTITLSEEAYNRLREWKRSADDSFSAVVLRQVPRRGTLGDLLAAFEEMPPLSEAAHEEWLGQREAARRVDIERDPWTSSPTQPS